MVHWVQAKTNMYQSSATSIKQHISELLSRSVLLSQQEKRTVAAQVEEEESYDVLAYILICLSREREYVLETLKQAVENDTEGKSVEEVFQLIQTTLQGKRKQKETAEQTAETIGNSVLLDMAFM